MTSALLSQRRLMLTVTLIVGAFALFFPARQLIQQRDHLDSLEERLSALRSENGRLAGAVGRLNDPGELEVMTRDRLGLVRPGEEAYFVEPTAPTKPDSTEQPASRGSLWHRAWTWLVTTLRGRG